MRKLLVLVLAASGLAACKSDPPATPTPSDESIIEVFREPVLTPEAVIPSRDSSLVGVEVFPGRLIFTYDAAGASVPGAGAVVAGVEEGGYLRRVMSVSELSATRFELTTEHAYLVDLFEDVHFRARFEPERGSWVETGRVGSRTDALGGSFNLIDDLPISEHCGIAPGSNLEVKVDLSPTFDAEIDIFRRRGRTMRVELGGDVKVSVEVVGGAGIGVNCEFEIPAERLPSREFTNLFFVGWVPVVITHTIQAEVKLEVGASVSAGQVTANAEGGFGFRTGVTYAQDDGGWSPIGTATRFGSASLDLTEPGTATVTAKFQPGISYLLKFYDTAGPQIALRPNVEGELTANYCTWEGTVTGGLTAALAPKVEVPVFDISLVEVNFNLDLFSGEIWSGDGTFPWCNDGGVEDGAVVGSDAGVGDGGVVTDGEVADPCSTHSSCEDCNRADGCGFCRASGACMSDSRRGECGSGWLDAPSSCPDCSGLGSCETCVLNGFCGWCPGQGCLNQRTEEASMCSGFMPASCG